MLKSALRVALTLLLWSAISAMPAPAASRGSHGSHGGGGHFHAGGSSHGGGGSHSSFSSHRGGGSFGHSMNSSRGMFGSSRGNFGRSAPRAGSASHLDSRNHGNFGSGRPFAGGRPQGNWGMSSHDSRGSFSSRNAWGGNPSYSRNSLPSRNFSSPSRSANNRSTGNSWNTAARSSASGLSGNRSSSRSDFGRAGSYDSNRPPFAQSRASNQAAQAFRRNSSARGAGSFARPASSYFNRSANSPAFASNRAASAASFARSATGAANFARHASFGANDRGWNGPNRPPAASHASLGNFGGRSDNSSSNASFLHSSATRASLGNSGFGGVRTGNGRLTSNHFDGGRFRNASMSRTGANGGFGSGRFGGSRNSQFGNRFGHSGYGYGRFGGHGGYNRFGYGHYGYAHFGYGGFGWYSGWDDPFGGLWFLDDLFGLALNVARFAIMPAWQVVGGDLLGAGIQAVANLGNDNNSYGGYGDDSYGYNNEVPYPSYNAGYSMAQPYYATRADFVSTPCGNYYSDENPGCVQRFQ